MISILQDDKQSNDDRARAAAWIGQTQYVMGIPALLDNVWLANPVAANDSDTTDRYPCATALASFDCGASIDFADRIARSSTMTEVQAWKRAIQSKDALRGVITHLHGMVVEEQDASRRAKLQSAIQILRDEIASGWFWLIFVVVLLSSSVIGRFLLANHRRSSMAT